MTSPAGRRLTESHRLAQRQLAAQMVAQSVAVWTLLDPEDLDGTVDGWVAAMLPIVEQMRSRSTAAAALYLRAFRLAEVGNLSGFTVETTPVVPTAIATSLVVCGPVSIKAAMTAGRPLARAVDIALARVGAATSRHVLSGGRDAITETVRSDSRAVGYQRVTSGTACDYCAGLAEGPVWANEERANFDAHDGCNCSAEPLYAV